MGKQQGKIHIACTGSATIDFHELVEIQGSLKIRSAGDIQRMRRSIQKYGFSFPFFVWQTKTKSYVLDGHGRLEALRDLEDEGFEIPPLPIVHVEAKSKKEAKQKLLRLNSQYGEFTIEGIEDFTSDISVDWDDIALPSGKLEPGQSEDAEENYSRNVESPIYEPTGEQPTLTDCVNLEKRNQLVADIEKANITQEQKTFLKLAAERHTEFDYRAIAEYYSHADPEMQRLMENSALVIIDIGQAIESGFVKLTKRLQHLYESDYVTR